MPGHSRIPCLDVFRSVAVLWVIAYHVEGLGWFPRNTFLHAMTSFGSAGVDLFFVLSGFLIGGIVLRELETTRTLVVTRFWSRRWLRTLPAYYVTLAFVYVVDHALGRPFPEAWTYLVFLQNYASPMDRFTWSWSLCVEEHFYFVLPLVLVALSRVVTTLSARGALRIIAAIGIFVSVTSRVLVDRHVDLSHAGWDTFRSMLYELTHCRLDGLAIGIFLATLDLRKSKSRYAVGWFCFGVLQTGACIVLNAAHHVFFAIHGYLFLATGFGAIVYGSVRTSLRDIAPPGTRLAAELSYALYLVHPVVLRALRPLVGFPLPVRVATAAVATFVAAYGLRRGVELPILRWRDRVDPASRIRP